MNKFGKMRVIAAFTLALTMLASVAAPSFASAEGESVIKSFEPRAVEIDGENEALSGWQYYFYNQSLTWYYQSDELFVRATKNGRTGNAMEIERKKATDELWVYSYSFDVESSTEYTISSFVKTTDDSCKLVYCVKELDENGQDVVDSAVDVATQYVDRYSFSGKYDDWGKASFTRKTEATTKKVILRIRAEGTGTIYLDDVTVRKVIAPNSDIFQMIGVGNDGKTEDPATMPVLSGVNISSDSSDGDGKSLKLEHYDVYKTVFGMLPHDREYKLSFKYKNTGAGTADRLSIRIDNETPAGSYYAPGVSSTAGVADTEWQTYEFTFTPGKRDVNWMGITAYGGYLIDELKITGTDEGGATMQYIVNGSFSGAYLEGYNINNNINVAKQEDGTYVFASSSVTKDTASGQRGYFRFDTTGLKQGETYTLSFDYRSGGGGAAVALYGTYWNDQITLGSCGQSTIAGWTSKSFDFVAGTEVTDRGDNTTVRNATAIELYGDAGIGWPTYFRNISIKDAAGNEFITNKTLVTPETLVYFSDFGTGNTEYTWSDWEIENGGIYGFKYEDGNDEYKVCLNGSAGNPATAVTKDIDVAGARLISVDKKIDYTADSAFGSNLTVTVLAGEKEIAADENGLFSLPEGTTTVKIKFSTEEYVTFKKVFVKFTGIGTVAGASIRANTPYGIRWTVRVKTAEWNKLVETYGEANVKAGVIIAPLDYLGSGETAVPFTIDAFKAANKKYVDIVTDTFNAKLENKVEGYSGFYASLVNIKAGNLNRKFIARSYVAVTKDGVTAYYYGEYSAEDNARTIYEVGKGAIASDKESENVKTFVKNEVLDKIADVTVKDGVAAMTAINGYTSPYSVSINGKVLTITAMDGADVNLSEVLKIVCVNGKNYKPTVSGNLATVTIN